jgi:hypothetical protein
MDSKIIFSIGAPVFIMILLSMILSKTPEDEWVRNA